MRLEWILGGVYRDSKEMSPQDAADSYSLKKYD